MADRFFPNKMPDFVEEVAEEEAASDFPKDSLTKLFSLPYKTLADVLKNSALDLKQTVPQKRLLFFWHHFHILLVGLEIPTMQDLVFTSFFSLIWVLGFLGCCIWVWRMQLK